MCLQFLNNCQQCVFGYVRAAQQNLNLEHAVKKFRRNWTAYAMPVPHTIWLQIPCQYRTESDWRFFASTAKNWLKVPCEHRTIWLNIPFQSCTQGDRRFPASTAQNSTGNSAPSPPTSPQYQHNFEDSSYRKVSIMVVNWLFLLSLWLLCNPEITKTFV